VRGAIRYFLETRTPYRVCDEAGDGVSAIQKAEKSRCDMVLLDLAMPSLDGAEAASILRRTLPHTKIVGFSALAGDVDLKGELLASRTFDAVLSKSDGLEKLAETIKALLPS
jgi:two-component system, autoinducer 1 sensor kinase/phosphatase LuxN